MMDSISQIILICAILVGIIIVYRYYSTDKTEKFTALSGFNPLTSYDDYGNFNFIFHEDDLPYYDVGFKRIMCTGNAPYTDFDKDSFIDYQGFKVRRELVPSNYTDDDQLSNADFDKNPIGFFVKKDRPRDSSEPPQPHNYYFSNIK
jgi:hypothetical protein